MKCDTNKLHHQPNNEKTMIKHKINGLQLCLLVSSLKGKFKLKTSEPLNINLFDFLKKKAHDYFDKNGSSFKDRGIFPKKITIQFRYKN